jgi:hypothetical protein
MHRSDTRTRSAGPALTRRRLLGTAALAPLAGCLTSPSSSSPPHEAVEVDDGHLYGPGLTSELDEAFYAALVLERAGADRFLRARLTDEARAFLDGTDFATQLMGVIQVAGVNSSTVLDVVDLALTPVNLTVVLALRDQPPHSDDRVITTLLVRVPRRGGNAPERIWVELGIDGRDVTFSGERVP